MTLLAAYKSHGMPVLVGDAVCGFEANDTFHPTSLRKKVYMISSNLSVGWTGSVSSAEVVLTRLMNDFYGKEVSLKEFESLLTTIEFDNMLEKNVKIVGWIIDEQPKSFIWQSGYSSELFFEDYYHEGTGEEFWRDIITSGLAHGGDGPRDGSKFSEEIGAVQETLTYCGEAFFREFTSSTWHESFGFAYEVLVYAHGRFWPVGNTIYLGWEYIWNTSTQTGSPKLGPFVAKTNFREHYSVLQMASHKNLQIERCRNYPIRPVYEHEIAETLTFGFDFFDADFYVHYFWCGLPDKQAVLRIPYVCGKTQRGDKLWLRRENGKVKFEIDTSKFNQIFKEAMALLK